MVDVVHRSLEYPGYWRIAWFGKLSEIPKPGLPDLRIRVYLGRISDSSHPIAHGKLPSDLRTAYLPVGELPRLHLNAILLDGRLVSHEILKLKSEEKKIISLNTDRDNITVFDRFQTDRNGLVIPKSPYTDESDPDKNALFVGIGSKDDPYAVIAPAVEVFRFFYATSDVLAKTLLSDRFLDPNTNLWNTTISVMDKNSGQAAIWLRRRMLDADARFLARFAFDKYALEEAQNIFLYAAAYGRSKAAERMIRAIPPFQGTNKFTALCREIGGNSRRILITRFLSCDWMPPFKELKWDRDNDGRTDPDKREERKPTNWKPRLLAFPPDSGTPHALSTVAPSGNNVPSRLKEVEITERFPNLGDVPSQKLPQVGAKTKSEPGNWKFFSKSAYEGSVIDGQSSFDFVGKTVIESLELKNKTMKGTSDEIDSGVCEEEYLNILDLLLSINSNKLAEVSFLTVLESYNVVKDTEFNVYPPDIDDKKKAWLYIDSEKTSRRMALLASVLLENNTRYVLELQQRKPGECSTLVFWASDGKPLSQGMLAILVMDCAHSNAARLTSANSLGVCWARLHHTTKSGGDFEAKHYLRRIYTATNIDEL